MGIKKAIGLMFLLFIFCVFRKEIKATSTSLVISNLPHSNEYFTGREEILTKIKASFDEGQSSVVIAGFLGTGKTQTARKFAELQHSHYDIVWFLDAKKSIVDQYKMLASQLNDSNWLKKDNKINLNAQANVLLEKINQFLQSTKRKWLIIFDNVQDRKEILVFLPPKIGHVLITTRNEEGWVNPIKLGKFKREESIALLKKLTHFEDITQLDHLASLLFDHPLSLIQAACYIRKHYLDNAEVYCKLYSNRRRDLWKREEHLLKKDHDIKSIHDDYQMTAETALRLSLEELKHQAPLSLNLLYLTSFWHNTKMPEDILARITNDLGYDDVFDYNDAISELVKLALFEKEKIQLEQAGTETTFSMFDLTSVVLLDMQSVEEKKTNIRKNLKVFSKFLAGGWDKISQTFSKRSHLLAHIETLCRHAVDLKLYDSSLIELKLYLLEYHMYHTRNQEIYETLIQEISSLVKEVKEISPLILARFYIDRVYSRSIFSGKDGQFVEKIEKDYEDAIQIFERDTAYIEELFRAYMNFAQHHLLQGEYKKSIEIIRKAEKLLNAVKSESYKNLFFFVNAFILCEGEDYSSANKWINQAIERVEKEENMPLRVYIKNMKAWTDLRLGKLESAYQWALETQKQALEIFEEKNNDAITWALIIKAVYKKKKGDLDGAEKEIRESLERLTRNYGGSFETEDQAYGHIILGNIYVRKDQLVEAKNAYEIAEKIYGQIYSTVEGYGPCELYTNSAILGAKIKDDFLAKHYFDLHKKHFAEDSAGEKNILQAFEDNNVEILW
jgi:tetratricopeptide (TPR) repeat protein